MLTSSILTFLFFSYCLCDDNPLVKTPLGEIQGYVKTSANGRKYSAFEGIPYAKPPIGDLRFEEPVPIEPWTGVWIANLTTMCVQTDFMPGSATGSTEDCLHVNVYVPRERPNPAEKLDVVVDIHGGAFMYGKGDWYTTPLYLMDSDVVFVTFNYRLGILGFLSTQDEVVPGNNGLKDQVLALKWIQENIASFGGNPDSVTLIGCSAGGISVHLHYLSEQSRGLFHRGWSQSGTALISVALQEEPLMKARILADGVGCPTSSNKEMVHCLKQRPYQHILAQLKNFYKFAILPYVPFGPVVEKWSKNPFLPDDPYRLLLQGEVYDVPWIASNTAHEGLVTLLFANQDAERITTDFEDLAQYLLDFEYTLPKSQWKDVAKKVKKFYIGEEEIDKDKHFLNMVKMFSDRIFIVDSENTVRLQAEVAKSPVYYYYFNYPGNAENKMVEHGADLKYFYGNAFLGKDLGPNELKMKDVMINMLLSYVKTNKPTVSGVDWQPTGYDQLTYLNITSPDNIKQEIVPELTPRSFWKSLGIQENENIVSVKDEL